MKITVLYFGKTISGLPGSVFTFLRKRNPCLNKKLLTEISGLVSLPEMEAMIWLRFFFVKMSAKMFDYMLFNIFRLYVTEIGWQSISNQ